MAKLAGLPAAVIERAKLVLARARSRGPHLAGAQLIDDLPLFAAARAPAGRRRATRRSTALIAALAALDPDELSPREALEALYALKAQLAEDAQSGLSGATSGIGPPAGSPVRGPRRAIHARLAGRARTRTSAPRDTERNALRHSGRAKRERQPITATAVPYFLRAVDRDFGSRLRRARNDAMGYLRLSLISTGGPLLIV